MKKAFLYALAFHVALVIFLLLDLKFFPSLPDESPKPLVIDYVMIGPKTAAPKKSLDQVAERKVEKKAEEPKKIEEKAEPEPEVAAQNAKRVEEKVEEKKEEDKPLPPEKKPDPVKKPIEKKKKEEPKKKKKEKEKATNKKAEINISKNKKKSDKKEKDKQKKALDDLIGKIDQDNSADVDDIAPVLTTTDINALRQKVAKCWVVPAGSESAKDLVVDVDMVIARDGTVVKADIVDQKRMKTDSLFNIAAESAKRAVLDPECNPLPLPLSKYDQWKNLTLSFNPKDMFNSDGSPSKKG